MRGEHKSTQKLGLNKLLAGLLVMKMAAAHANNWNTKVSVFLTKHASAYSGLYAHAPLSHSADTNAVNRYLAKRISQLRRLLEIPNL